MLPPFKGKYVEPFAGSACLFFHIHPREAVLGDINAPLIAFYNILARDPEKLHRAVRRFRADGSDYYRVRSIRGRVGSISAGAHFLYLNRFSFNGVYRTNRSGMFNVPKGQSTGGLPSLEHLTRAAVALSRTQRITGDFEVALALAEKGDFVYLDPPYARRRDITPGEYGYQSLNGEEDLARLGDALGDLTDRGVKYLVSYMKSTRAARLLPHTHSRFLRVRRNVGGFSSSRRWATEMLLANYRI